MLSPTALQHQSPGTHWVMGIVAHPVNRSPGLQNLTGCAGRRFFENPVFEMYSIDISMKSFVLGSFLKTVQFLR